MFEPTFETAALHDAFKLIALSAEQRNILELAARGAPLADALNATVRAVAQLRGPETRAGIFIFEPTGLLLKFGAAAGLEEGYTTKIDNFAIGANQPSCGKAAFVGQDIIVGDVASDAAWAPYLELAQEYNIRACWSFLLKGSRGQVLGTLALYHRTPCEPHPADYEQVRYFAKIASYVIEKHIESVANKSGRHPVGNVTLH